MKLETLILKSIPAYLFLALNTAQADTPSVFGPSYTVYRMHYTTHIQVAKEESTDSYNAVAIQHSNYMVGALAYIKDSDNFSATGSPLRKKEDLKVVSVKPIAAETVDLTYAYDGEVVLDHRNLTAYTLYLPEKLDQITNFSPAEIGYCSFLPGYVDDEDLLPVYWLPLSKRCPIPYQTINASLEPVVMKKTYPDYPRLVQNGEIKVEIAIGKMSEGSGHNPYRLLGDQSGMEYQSTVKKLKHLGFVCTDSIPADGIDSSLVETFEGTFGKIKIIVKMIYGNATYATETQQVGVRDFYSRFISLAKESSYIVYSGHAGFLEDSDLVSYYPNHELILEPNRYQIFVMNSCQSNTYLHLLFSTKSSENLDIFVTARETTINADAATVLMDAITQWAQKGNWSSYPELVNRMDTVDAMLGVVGEQDNPTAPYELKP